MKHALKHSGVARGEGWGSEPPNFFLVQSPLFFLDQGGCGKKMALRTGNVKRPCLIIRGGRLFSPIFSNKRVQNLDPFSLLLADPGISPISSAFLRR